MRAARWCRSTAGTRPASSPRPRTGCTSPPSTSPPTTAAELVALLQRWTEAAALLTAGQPVGDGDPAPYNAPPRDTGEAGGLSAARLTLTFGFGPGLFGDGAGLDRFGLAGRRPAAARAAPPLPGRPARPGAQRRRPVRAGVRRRPAGRRARDPQPGPAGVRHRGDPLVPARLRPDLVDQPVAGDPAQPVRLQGRHRQPQGRGRRDRAARVGPARRRSRGRVAGRRQLPRRPADQHEHRDLGPHVAGRAGDAGRP